MRTLTSGRHVRVFVAALLVALATQTAQAEPGRTWHGQTVHCDRVSGPQGSDRGPGTMRRPFRTAAQLIARLRSGQTGCLLGGVYNESLVFAHGGSVGNPIVLTSVGKNRATIAGFVEVPQSAPFVTLQNLNIDGATTLQQTVQLFAADTVLRHLDITNQRKSGSCIQIGGLDYGIATRTVIDHNRIHDCGLNASVGGDHGLYVAASQGVQITNNIIFNSAGFGIQLYPDAQNTLIKWNLVYKSGVASVIFAGSGDHASSGNVVTKNVLAGTADGFAVTSSWDGSTGSSNLLIDNCIWNNGRPAVAEQSGFSAKSNHTLRPQLLNGSSGPRQTRSSPCRAYGPR
jgi:parallel beta-helix repeat protein